MHYKGSNARKQKLVHKFSQEITNCQLSYHKNVVQIFGAATWSGSIAIVMEYLAGGSLAEFVQDEDIKIGVFLKLRFCFEIASGLTYLHNLEPKRLIHGDLKPGNVLLTEDLHCKLGDFGSSVLSSYTEKTTTGQACQQSECTPIYAAPELLLNPTIKKTPALDTYSFSIIIYVVLKREAPVPGKNVENLHLESIKNGKRPSLSFIDGLSKHVNDQEFDIIKHLVPIMQQCWSHNPSRRPSLTNVHQHLLQMQASVDAATVAKQVAASLDGMTVMNPIQSNYRCAPLNMFHPPSFQLFHSEASQLSSLSIADPLSDSTPTHQESVPLFNTMESALTHAKMPQSISSKDEIVRPTPRPRKLSKQKQSESSQPLSTSTRGFSTNTTIHSTPSQLSAGFLALSGLRVFHVDAKTFHVSYLPDLENNHRLGSLSKLGNNVYAIGGTCKTAVETIDLTNPQQWEKVCSTSKYRSASAAHKDFMYTTGGRWNEPTVSGERYNNEVNMWSDIKNMIYKRDWHALVSLEDFLYAIGGHELSSAEQYNPQRNEWHEIAPMTTVRQGHQAVSFKRSIYSIGGRNDCNALNIVERYDPRVNGWSRLNTIVKPRSYCSACVIEEKIFIAGGSSNPIIEVFDPVNNKVIKTHPVDECSDVHSIAAL